jgi:hypothetical protein
MTIAGVLPIKEDSHEPVISVEVAEPGLLLSGLLLIILYYGFETKYVQKVFQK